MVEMSTDMYKSHVLIDGLEHFVPTVATGPVALQIGPQGKRRSLRSDSGQAPTAAIRAGLLRGRSGNIRTVRLTIAGTGGSIVAQSCQEMVGDVAQLVERRNGIAEATGSTPVVSTNLLWSHDYPLRSSKPDERQAICGDHKQLEAPSCRASEQIQQERPDPRRIRFALYRIISRLPGGPCAGEVLEVREGTRMVEYGICCVRVKRGQSARLRRVKRARERACAPWAHSTPVVSNNPFFGAFGRVSKSLAFFPSSITLTRLLRRKALLGRIKT